LGIRFPYRAENLIRPMADDSAFSHTRDKSYIVIAEVKTDLCDLNGPWTNPERRNMLRVLMAIGAFPSKEAEIVAQSLYEDGRYSSQLYQVSLMCIGAIRNAGIELKYPRVPQIIWQEILTFIYDRFHVYRNQKQSHGQWDANGKALWTQAERCRTPEQFIQNVSIRG
jgi:hypothetical protein